MGLLTFDRRVGRHVFDASDEAVALLRQLVEDSPLDVRDLDVGFAGGVVTVLGRCDSQATKDRVILLLGNVEGIEQVISDGLVAPDLKAGQVPDELIYTVKIGDTPSSIADHFYGEEGKLLRIIDANRDIVPDPENLTPGLKILIPIDWRREYTP